MKTLLILFFNLAVFTAAPKLSELRADYPKANSDELITNKLFKELASVNNSGNKTLVAYKGAILTLKAKYAKGFKSKKTFFKEGALLIEYAVESEPKNIEIRCLRLGVQENSPKIVGYKENIIEDKQYILDHYKEVSNKEIKKFIKGYVELSHAFSESEKQLF